MPSVPNPAISSPSRAVQPPICTPLLAAFPPVCRHILKAAPTVSKNLQCFISPNIAPASASIRLKAWIKDSPELLQTLAGTNYHLTARVLTPRQTCMIENAFGSPF